MTKNDITRDQLYESVKFLLECDSPHIHLNQHKLHTLFSVGFQYFLYLSTKEPGHYIIRIEDHFLADKLVRRAKDDSTRKFLQNLLIPRKLKYGQSVFYLDYFHIGTWGMTNSLPKEKVRGALVVKNTTDVPMMDETEIDLADLPKDYFLRCLHEFVPRTIVIAFDNTFDNTKIIRFPFIKDKAVEVATGVKVSSNLDTSSFE